MTRFSVALIGLLIGCLVGWYVPSLLYPWDTVRISSLPPVIVGEMFKLFGLCLGAPLGFVVGSLIGARWIPNQHPMPAPLPPVDPQKVEDNLG
jgi:hypothetical protein